MTVTGTLAAFESLDSVESIAPNLREEYLLALMERDAEIWHQHHRMNIERGIGAADVKAKPTTPRTIAAENKREAARYGMQALRTARKAEKLAPTHGQRREQKRARDARYVESMSAERREADRLHRREHMRAVRAARTPAEREQEAAKRRAHVAAETPEQREERLAARRAWYAAQVAKKAASAPATRPPSIGTLAGVPHRPRALRLPHPKKRRQRGDEFHRQFASK
jgi:hypothetical protein